MWLNPIATVDVGFSLAQCSKHSLYFQIYSPIIFMENISNPILLYLVVTFIIISTQGSHHFNQLNTAETVRYLTWIFSRKIINEFERF